MTNGDYPAMQAPPNTNLTREDEIRIACINAVLQSAKGAVSLERQTAGALAEPLVQYVIHGIPVAEMPTPQTTPDRYLTTMLTSDTAPSGSAGKVQPIKRSG